MTAAPETVQQTSFSLDDISRLVAQARSNEESQLTKLMESNFGRVLDRVESMDKHMRDGFGKFEKILDDHESRLRQQHDMDSKQSGEIGALRENYAKLQGDLKAMEARLDGEIKAVQTALQTRQQNELGFWQKAALAAIQFAVFGGSMGGVVVAVMRVLGVL